MLLSKTLQKQGQLMSVATKVGIQINAKLGGEIWAVQIPVCSFFSSHYLIINFFCSQKH
jgi:aubergine-like protein